VVDGERAEVGAGGEGAGRRTAILLSPDRDTAEIEALAGSAGMRVVRTFVQRIDSPNPKFHIGEGKVEEVARYLKPGGNGEGARGPLVAPALAVFNGDLKPTQVFHLEKALGIPVFDRVRLILEIFTLRANSPEARLQVELAHLQYDVPLVREYIHRTRTGEHPGLFFAGGAYQVDDYYEMIKARMARIRRELSRIGGERAQRRKTRRRGGQALLALAGYTNAGKSALFRALTDEHVAVDDELFTTLSTTTRRLRMPLQGSKALLSDTVGFIRNLPPWLVEAFLSTLEEVFLSDAIILVVDLSDPLEEMLSKLGTTLGILRKGARPVPVIAAFNKTDIVDHRVADAAVAAALARFGLPLNCRISAATGEGLPGLLRLSLSSLGDFFFGEVAGPSPDFPALAAEGIRPGRALGGGRSCAADVLLQNWKAQELSRRLPALVFSRQ
jgi:GTP-binding protein HflX